jgi:hypothetical protein
VQRTQGAQTTLQSGPRLHGLQSVPQTSGSTHTPSVPANERLIGPGRSSTVSISGLPDDAAQMFPAKREARRLPPPERAPVCWMVRPRTPVPKAPGLVCPGQKKPLASAVTVDVPVLTWIGLLKICPTYWLGRGRHSFDVPEEPMPPEQLSPCRAPAVQVPATHRGHGSVGFWVR